MLQHCCMLHSGSTVRLFCTALTFMYTGTQKLCMVSNEKHFCAYVCGPPAAGCQPCYAHTYLARSTTQSLYQGLYGKQWLFAPKSYQMRGRPQMHPRPEVFNIPAVAPLLLLTCHCSGHICAPLWRPPQPRHQPGSGPVRSHGLGQCWNVHPGTGGVSLMH